MNRKEIEDRVLLLALTGSHAYGLNTEHSDEDYKGCFVADKKHYLGFSNVYQKDAGWDDFINDPPSKFPLLNNTDTCLYELSKFINLILGNNPTCLELLFLDDKFYIYKNPLIEPLIQNRDSFLSKKIGHSLLGYGHSQLKKIEVHKKWLLDPPTESPRLEDYGLEEPFIPLTKNEKNTFLTFLYLIIRETLERMPDMEDLTELLISKIDIKELLKTQFMPDEVIDYAGYLTRSKDDFMKLLHATHLYYKALKNWRSYQSWKVNRNKERAKLEAKIGYDAKFGSHAYRLIAMGIDTFKYGKFVVNRRKAGDVDYILSIKQGNIPYEELMSKTEVMMEELKDLRENNNILRDKPDSKLAEDICISILEDYMV